MKQIAFADFGLDEYRWRVERTQEALERGALDVLILTEPANLRYLFGFQDQLQLSATRLFVGVFPRGRSDQAALFLPHDCQGAPQSWVEHIVFWDEGHPPPFDDRLADVGRVANYLDDLGLAGSRIGLELGFGTHVAIPIEQFDRLRTLLRQATLVDASALLWQVRRIKSEAEIQCLRRAGQITLAAYRAALETLQEGMTEAELFRLVHAEMFRRGIEGQGLLSVLFGLDAWERPHLPATEERRLRPGDWVYLDGGGTVHGYYADVYRMVFFGESAPSAQLAVHKAVREANEAMIEAIRPGVPCGRLYEIAQEVLTQAGFGYMMDSLSVGHSIGLNLHEMPDLRRGNQEPLEQGMVLCLEPWVLDGPNPVLGLFNHEDMVAVRRDGAEVLTTEPGA